MRRLTIPEHSSGEILFVFALFLAVSQGRLVLATTDGKVTCYSGR